MIFLLTILFIYRFYNYSKINIYPFLIKIDSCRFFTKVLYLPICSLKIIINWYFKIKLRIFRLNGLRCVKIRFRKVWVRLNSSMATLASRRFAINNLSSSLFISIELGHIKDKFRWSEPINFVKIEFYLS